MEAKATFGAGCFWGVEAAFRRLDGVTATEVGYAGGQTDSPSYEQVCGRPDRSRRGRRGHVRPREDPVRAAARRLLGRARPDPAQPAGAGRRRPVPLGDLRPRRRPARGGRGSRGTAFSSADRAAGRDGDRGRPGLLAGRGLSPAVPREARPRDLSRVPRRRDGLGLKKAWARPCAHAFLVPGLAPRSG